MEESILQYFDRLEARLETLLRSCDALKSEKAELAERVEELTRRVEELSASEERFQQERSLVRSKVESLIARLGDSGNEPSETETAGLG